MQLTTYHDAVGFTALANEWNDLLEHSEIDTIFMTHEWQSVWWRAFCAGRELLLLAYRQDGTLVGVAPLYRQVLTDGRVVVQLVGGTAVSDYLGIITTPEHRERVCEATIEYFTTARADWDKLDFHCLPASSPYQSLCQIAETRGLLVQSQVEDVCPIIALPASWDEYLSMLNKKQRHELRRKIRRAAREAAVDWYMATNPETLYAEMETFFDLHRKSSADKDDFMNDPAMQAFFHEVARFSLARGWLELSFLTINGAVAAAMLCFSFNNRTLVYNSGYDARKYRHLSPGILLLSYHIEDSIAKGRTAFDFLRGDEVYKYRFGGQDSEVFRVTISPRKENGDRERR